MEKCECIFCGNTVEKSITALLAITEWEKPEEEQQSQQFFCHLKCLRNAIKNPDHLYIGDE